MEPQHIVEREPLRDAFAAQGILAFPISSGMPVLQFRKQAEAHSK